MTLDFFWGGGGGTSDAMTALLLIADWISRLQSVQSQKKSLILRPLPVFFFSLSLCCICSSTQNCKKKKKKESSVAVRPSGTSALFLFLSGATRSRPSYQSRNANLWPHPLSAAHKHPADKQLLGHAGLTDKTTTSTLFISPSGLHALKIEQRHKACP